MGVIPWIQLVGDAPNICDIRYHFYQEIFQMRHNYNISFWNVTYFSDNSSHVFWTAWRGSENEFINERHINVCEHRSLTNMAALQACCQSERRSSSPTKQCKQRGCGMNVWLPHWLLCAWHVITIRRCVGQLELPVDSGAPITPIPEHNDMRPPQNWTKTITNSPLQSFGNLASSPSPAIYATQPQTRLSRGWTARVSVLRLRVLKASSRGGRSLLFRPRFVGFDFRMRVDDTPKRRSEIRSVGSLKHPIRTSIHGRRSKIADKWADQRYHYDNVPPNVRTRNR